MTGPGGIGKTRLALRITRQVQRSFPGGAWVVDLAPLADDRLLAQTVLTGLGLDHAHDDTGRSPMAKLVDRVAGQRLLLVLDNCEHLLDSCAYLACSLLKAAPELQVLVTSRQALGADGEFLLPVPPLSVPSRRLPPSREEMLQYEAVRLFVDRGSAVLGDFTPREEQLSTVARICRRLDGIPLALELAAALLRVLSPEQVLDRLDDPFNLLTWGNRAAPPRQQTLRAAIDRSFDLCTGPERLLWTRAAVFRGGFDLEAAESVCSGEDLVRTQVFAAVAALVDKSVLIRECRHGTARYHMLETIREYGDARLSDSGRQEAARRHREHYQRLAARAEAEWFGRHQTAWNLRLRQDRANLRAALEYWLSEPGQERAGLELVASLWSHRYGSGPQEERHWLERVIALDTEPSPAKAKVLWADGWLALLRGDITTGEARTAQCRAVADELGDEAGRADAVQVAGLASLLRDDLPTAVSLLEDALEGHRATKSPEAQCATLFLLTLAHALAGSPRAAALGAECLTLCDTHGAPWSRSYALWVLGLRHWLDGKTHLATGLLQDGLRGDHATHNLPAVALCLEVLAWARARQGHHELAAELLGAARSTFRLAGTPLTGPLSLLRSREACETHLRESMGTARFAAAVRTGNGLTVDQAIACALGRTSAVPPTVHDANTPPDAPATQPGHCPLTRREREVATLLTEGLTDYQIAARLTISPRTAEGHVQHILTKLGFTSRTQVAVWAVGHRSAVQEPATGARAPRRMSARPNRR